MFRYIFYVIFFCLTKVHLGFAIQNNTLIYRKAYQYFLLQDYTISKNLFEQCIEKSINTEKKAYSTFYYALSAYYNKEKDVACSTFLAMQDAFKTWDKIDEVYYWLSQINFEKKSYEEALGYIMQCNNKNKVIIATKLDYIDAIDDVDILIKILSKSMVKDIPLAKAIVKKLMKKTWVSLHDYQSFIKKHGLVNYIENFYKKLPLLKKDVYHVGVILPFFTEILLEDSISNNFATEKLYIEGHEDTKNYQVVMQNAKIAIDFYQGLLLAVEALKKENITVQIHPYDSRGCIKEVKKILDKEIISKMDIIIGPITEKCIPLVNDFTQQHKINIWHPFTQNIHYIENNLYAFLFHPSVVTEMRTIKRLYDNDIQSFDKKIAIIYGTAESDIQRAFFFKKVFDNQNQNEQLPLMLQIDTHMAQSMVYNVKNFKPSSKKNKGLSPKIFDGLTHIYIASDDDLLVANILSIIAFLKLPVQIIGHTSWLDLQSISLAQIQSMQVKMLQSYGIDYTALDLPMLRDKFLQEYNAYPTYEALLGYEVLFFLGNMLNNEGRFFIKKPIHYQPYILGLRNFSSYKRDNQHVDIFSFDKKGLLVKKNDENIQ